MGVPKFYRWLSERYPCLSEVIDDSQIPTFDCLYLDMNGIIHTCSHPNDEDAHFRISEEDVFKDIFRYIDALFGMVGPKKVFFMAVDGVAPRAKMNQQRGRRFMSARNAEMLEAAAKKRGEALPEQQRFDSNCITPGTEFMVRLHEQLKYFVHMKISTDERWRGIRVFLSGHDCPGEGEHKIMDFIRHERSQPAYDPNTRHCLYGLDADLMMLGVSSHEPHFSLLREEVKFLRPGAKNDRSTDPEKITFHLLHLSLLREYLELEFQSLKESLTFDFDLESIIDDWVLMGFLVGNDFIPHLPNMHIQTDALSKLYSAYIKVLPTLDGYINEKGELNLKRFECFIAALSELDREHFGDQFDDDKWFESKRGGDGNRAELEPYDGDVDESGATDSSAKTADSSSKKGAFDSSDDDDAATSSGSEPMTATEAARRGRLRAVRSSTQTAIDALFDGAADADASDDTPPWDRQMEREFRLHKRDYYREKLDYANITKEELHGQAVGYVRAIQWNLHYYYNGCCSWNWFYEHHYAPYLSDIKAFSHLPFDYDLSSPFVPFEQLLAVLPAASGSLLPAPFQELMVDATSPIIDFYPTEFETDLNGKKNDWEAVVLIPFIREDRLIGAMATRAGRLSAEEHGRNTHGPHLLFTTAAQPGAAYPSSLPGVFSDVHNDLAVCTPLHKNTHRIARSAIVKGLLPGAKTGVFYPGFPTMQHIEFSAALQVANCKVFQSNSRKHSMIVRVHRRVEFDETVASLVARRANRTIFQDLGALSTQLVGQQVRVDWPFLAAAVVDSVSSKERVFEAADTRKWDEAERSTWLREMDNSKFFYKCRRGVELGEIHTMVRVRRYLGRRLVFDSKGACSHEMLWSAAPVFAPLQTIVQNVSVCEEDESLAPLSVADAFPLNSRVFVLSRRIENSYGASGVVLTNELQKGMLIIRLDKESEPNFAPLVANQRNFALKYWTGNEVADYLRLDGRLLSRITGTVYVSDEKPKKRARYGDDDYNGHKVNIGLNLKFTKKNLEVPDYTRKDDAQWLYSDKTVELLHAYKDKFAEVFKHLLSNQSRDDVYYAADVWPDDKERRRLKQLQEWLKALPCASVRRQTAGAPTLDGNVVERVEREVARARKDGAARSARATKLGVRPSALYRCCLSAGKTPPDAAADFHLFDRVVSVVDGSPVPLGLRGTVVGVVEPSVDAAAKSAAELQLDVLFDEPFAGAVQIRSTMVSGQRVRAATLVNLSFGRNSRVIAAQGPQAQAQRMRTNNGWPGAQLPQEQRQGVVVAPPARSAAGGVPYGMPPPPLAPIQAAAMPAARRPGLLPVPHMVVANSSRPHDAYDKLSIERPAAQAQQQRQVQRSIIDEVLPRQAEASGAEKASGELKRILNIRSDTAAQPPPANHAAMRPDIQIYLPPSVRERMSPPAAHVPPPPTAFLSQQFAAPPASRGVDIRPLIEAAPTQPPKPSPMWAPRFHRPPPHFFAFGHPPPPPPFAPQRPRALGVQPVWHNRGAPPPPHRADWPPQPTGSIPSEQLFVPFQVLRNKEPPQYVAKAMNERAAAEAVAQPVAAVAAVPKRESVPTTTTTNSSAASGSRRIPRTAPRQSRVAAKFSTDCS